jgi:hypothetical protein
MVYKTPGFPSQIRPLPLQQQNVSLKKMIRTNRTKIKSEENAYGEDEPDRRTITELYTPRSTSEFRRSSMYNSKKASLRYLR